MSGAERWRESRTEHWVTAAWAKGACKALALLNPDAGVFELEARVPHWDGSLAWTDPVWVVFPCDVAADAGLSVGCSHAVLESLGTLALGGSDDAGLAAETYRELISQATASVGAAVRSQTGTEVGFSGGVDVDESPDASLAVEFCFEIGGEKCSIALAPNAAFLESLGDDSAAADSAVDETLVKAQAETPGEDSLAEDLGGVAHRNLEMRSTWKWRSR